MSHVHFNDLKQRINLTQSDLLCKNRDFSWRMSDLCRISGSYMHLFFTPLVVGFT